MWTRGEKRWEGGVKKIPKKIANVFNGWPLAQMGRRADGYGDTQSTAYV